ncbi:MAG: hypothetical protein WBV94_21650 [Blastocatellia bacterium]
MSFISDMFLGNRPDMVMMPGGQEAVDKIYAAGDIGIGRDGKYAKQDLKAAREGRIEDMTRLRPVMSAINANKASSYTTADRVLRSNYAMEDTPGALTSAMLGEVAGQLDQNAGVQFANAAAGAYGDAESTLERNRFHRDDMAMNAATAGANATRGFMMDRSRKGGILPGLIQEWMSPKAVSGFF